MQTEKNEKMGVQKAIKSSKNGLYQWEKDTMT